jgi:hypothetical protein
VSIGVKPGHEEPGLMGQLEDDSGSKRIPMRNQLHITHYTNRFILYTTYRYRTMSSGDLIRDRGTPTSNQPMSRADIGVKLDVRDDGIVPGTTRNVQYSGGDGLEGECPDQAGA